VRSDDAHLLVASIDDEILAHDAVDRIPGQVLHRRRRCAVPGGARRT
jgi:hypothetical protein